MMNCDFNFWDYLLDDDIVRDYDKYCTKIHSEIIITNQPASIVSRHLMFGNLGAFPLLVYTGNGNIDLVHHVTPGIFNVLAGRESNYTAIVSLSELGGPAEVKGLTEEKSAKGKKARIADALLVGELADV